MSVWLSLVDGTADLKVLKGGLFCVHSDRAQGGALGADISGVLKLGVMNIYDSVHIRMQLVGL